MNETAVSLLRINQWMMFGIIGAHCHVHCMIMKELREKECEAVINGWIPILHLFLEVHV